MRKRLITESVRVHQGGPAKRLCDLRNEPFLSWHLFIDNVAAIAEQIGELKFIVLQFFDI